MKYIYMIANVDTSCLGFIKTVEYLSTDLYYFAKKQKYGMMFATREEAREAKRNCKRNCGNRIKTCIFQFKLNPTNNLY